MSDHHDIATAPGDLPAREVLRRFATVHDQFRHENTIEPLVPVPGEAVRVEALAGTAVPLDSARVFYTTDGSTPADDAPSVHMTRYETVWVPFCGYAAKWVATLPGQPEGTVVRYRIEGRTHSGERIAAQDGQGFWYRYPPEQSVTCFAYRVTERRTVPAWLEEAVIYQVFVDRFRSARGFVHADDLQAKHGGDLAGIRDAVPYLEELGVTCIWLSPVGPAPSYHRYDATDYFSVDPVLGTVEDMRRLTSAAHERGIRVILDFVPSHLSRRHPAFEAARTDPDAHTRDWFIFYEWPDRYRSFLDMVPSLVSLNTDSRGVREHLISSAKFWMECGIDGFRLDHVIGHGMDFWVEFQAALEAENPEVATIGEATDTGDALRRYHGRISGVLDFPIARALRLAFGTGDWSLAELDNFLDLYDDYMSPGPARVGFLDNHDMDRFLYVAGQDRTALALAALCMLTLPQTPVIYYGTEIGMSHTVSTSDRERGGDALARQDMEWRRERWDGNLQRLFRELIRFRRDATDAVRGGRTRLHLDTAAQTYAYGLGVGDEQPGEGQYVVVFNLADDTRELPLAVSGEQVVTTGPDVGIGQSSLSVPGRTGAVIRVAYLR